MHSPLFQVFVYLAAAVVSVPIAKRLGLGSVLGYLIAGALIGPSVLSLVNEETGAEHVEHVGEFGVVVMLFLIGLELRPARLWEMRASVLGLGGLQVVGTAVAVLAVTVACGQPWKVGLAAGLILAMSSTAIVLQSLGEKGTLKTPGGAACFSVLLFQDLAVIPILAVLPLLAVTGDAAGTGHDPNASARWMQAGMTLGAVAAVILGGRYALRPLFRYIADTRLREMFTATALGLVVGIALLMQAVGLSAALGTFLAGVVLADSEYRHQLEADLEPFKGLLLGLFFISVGAGINFHFVVAHPGLVGALVGGLLLLKFVVLLVLARAFRLSTDDSFLFAFGLAQGGEFAFVLITFCLAGGVLPAPAASALTAAVALSMAAAPLLFVANDRLVRWRNARRTAGVKAAERAADTVDPQDQGGVILAGFGRMGSMIGRALEINDVPVTILDHDADWVDSLREFGLKAYYGDALREDLLLSAGIGRAKLFIVTLGDQEQSLKLVDLLRADFPHLTLMVAANDRQHSYELIRRGVDPAHIFRETLGTSLEMAVASLRFMGFRATQAVRAARLARKYDNERLVEMAKVYDGDHEVYVSAVRQSVKNLESLLREDAKRRGSGGMDRGWDGPPMKSQEHKKAVEAPSLLTAEQGNSPRTT